MLFGDGQDLYTRQLMVWQQSIAAQRGAENAVNTKDKKKSAEISSSTSKGSSSKIKRKTLPVTTTTVKPSKSKTQVPNAASIQNRTSTLAICPPGQLAPPAASSTTTNAQSGAVRLPPAQTSQLDVEMLGTPQTQQSGESQMQVALYGESARKRRSDEVEEEDEQYSDCEIEERTIKRLAPDNNVASPQTSTRSGNAGPSQPSKKPPSAQMDDGDTYEDARSRAGEDEDDEDVLQDSNTETLNGLHGNESRHLVKVIGILETLSDKLDRLMTAQVNAASISKVVPDNQSAPSSTIRTTQPSRAARSLPKWDQTVEDMRIVEVQKREVAQEFYFNWLESVDSEFNSLACELIVRKLLVDWPALFTLNDRKDLRKMVRSHVKYLIKNYARQQAGCEDPIERARLLSASANRRRHTTFRQRLSVVEQVPNLQKHKALLCELGVDGTSSDEEDPDQPGLYQVKRITALGAEVREIKRKLDESYDILVRQPGFQGSRGRKRVYTNAPSTRKFRLKGLPVSCINTLWLKKLTPAQRKFYKFSDYNYDFEYPEEINSL